MHDRAHALPFLSTVLIPALLAALLAACSNSAGPSAADAAPAASSSSVPTTASASASATAMAAPDASPIAADTTTGNSPTAGADASVTVAASATATTSASAAPKGDDLAAANALCGTKPLPDCPLQKWMKDNTNPAIASGDLPALATALDKTVTFAPPGYTNWVSISKDGAKAAKAGDMAAAKASCRTCHDQYKAKYKANLRARKI